MDAERSGRTATACLTLLVIGCQAVAGLDDFRPHPPGAGGGGEGGGTLPLCVDGGFCVPDAPSGWQGPVCAQLYADPAGSCDAAYPTDLLFGGVGAATIGNCAQCTCADPTGETCAYEIETFASNDCTGGSAGTTAVTGNCSAGIIGASIRANAAVAVGGACTPAGGEDLALPAFNQFARLCEPGGGAASCDGGSCLPAIDGCNHCIWREGDVSCPPGPYEGDGVLLQVFDDQRRCDACSCAEATGGSCGTYEVRGYNSATCQPLNQLATTSPGSCGGTQPASSITHHFLAVGASVTTGGSCTALGGDAGEVVVDEAYTVCCAM